LNACSRYEAFKRRLERQIEELVEKMRWQSENVSPIGAAGRRLGVSNLATTSVAVAGPIIGIQISTFVNRD
jgi:hypothetical protein